MVSTTASQTRIVVGLGNPGAKYVGTRHNVGFEVLNCLSRRMAAPTGKSKFDGQYVSVSVGEVALVLLWPLTYMNNSGRCAKATADFYKIDAATAMLVVCDDLSLPIGKLRLRASGSAGGQKGLQDILRVFGNQSVPRLRVGIGQPPPRWDAADFVLGRFAKDEVPAIEDAVEKAADAIVDWCNYDLNYCMNRIN
ncbi:MAG: aminoacyl-tRNA hydrolase [Planctomycetales bacterium]|nr:aminoacyl-tRNA hydrolase [Planctomycetales bacterium]